MNTEKIPLYVKILAKLIPIIRHTDEYEENLSKGEIKKFNFVESQKNTHKFKDQVVITEEGYDAIWQHISDDYFKCIGKWFEGPQ